MTAQQAMQSGVPKQTAEALERYVNNHTHPGAFCYWLLKSDLEKSIKNADQTNLCSIVQTTLYVFERIPAHMLRDGVDSWINAGDVAELEIF